MHDQVKCIAKAAHDVEQRFVVQCESRSKWWILRGERDTRCLLASPEAITEQRTVVELQCKVVELVKDVGLPPKVSHSQPDSVDDKMYRGADIPLAAQIAKLTPVPLATDVLASPDYMALMAEKGHLDCRPPEQIHTTLPVGEIAVLTQTPPRSCDLYFAQVQTSDYATYRERRAEHSASGSLPVVGSCRAWRGASMNAMLMHALRALAYFTGVVYEDAGERGELLFGQQLLQPAASAALWSVKQMSMLQRHETVPLTSSNLEGIGTSGSSAREKADAPMLEQEPSCSAHLMVPAGSVCCIGTRSVVVQNWTTGAGARVRSDPNGTAWNSSMKVARDGVTTNGLSLIHI